MTQPRQTPPPQVHLKNGETIMAKNNRKSDAMLADDNDTNTKTTAQAKGQPTEAELTNTNPAAVKEQLRKNAAKHTEETMGDAVKQTRPRIPAGASPIEILGIHLGGDENTLRQRAVLIAGQKPSQAHVDTLAERIGGLAKKVKDKAINLVRHQDNPDSVQVYTRIALDELLSKGELTSKGIQDRYAQVPYKPGTCRAQGNQIMQLLPALDVAQRDGATLKLNEDSAIVQSYRAAKTAPKAQATA